MRRAASHVLLALSLSATASSALAAPPLSIALNESRRILVQGQVANVIVGDPKIADVAVVDTHSVVVLGKGYGVSDVMVLDRAGHTLLDRRVTVSAPEGERVTLHRGAKNVELACSPACEAAASGASSGGDDNGPAPDSGAPASN